MFNMKDLSDMAKLANDAKQIQAQQQKNEQRKIELLSEMNQKLDEILKELKK